MKQPTDTTKQQKIDPLMRIQEEIKEEMRREQEYKKLLLAAGGIPYTQTDNEDGETEQYINTESSLLNIAQVHATAYTMYSNNNIDTNSNNEKLNEAEHSDDSGISAASSPVNGATMNAKVMSTSNSSATASSEENLRITIKEPRYIGPNCYALTPEPPKQKLMLRTISTTTQRKLNVISTQKGLMERFIASRGKMPLANGNAMRKENDTAAAVGGETAPNAGYITLNSNHLQSLQATAFNFDKAENNWQPPVIERDQDGRPIRPGYVPVELKIQRELQDLKSRETELKKQRKVRQSTPDLLNALEAENIDYENGLVGDEDDDAESTEHCYGPNKLRSTKSISELCEPLHYFASAKNFKNDDVDGNRNDSMRPAVSLAQLCDLDPEEAPSSHRLIAQWESLIQQNA